MPSLAQFLAPNEREYFELFEQAGANVVVAATMLEEMLASYPDRRELASVIHDCEHEGDRITHALISRLNQTFVTPFDREDIHELASALDDIVDFTDEVADALAHLHGFKNSTRYTVEVHRLENEGDRIVRDAIGALFEGGIDPMVVIRWKDIYDRLEDAIDATERVANILEGIVIKNA